MRTERGLDRLVTFLDAVVAIAITLLVLPLAEVLGDSAPDDLGTALRESSDAIGAFFLSFVVIARMWLVHHRLVEHVGGYDRAFVLTNMVWILSIVVLPFATQVTSTYGSDRLAMAVYIGTITVSSAALTALALLVDRRPALRRGDAVHSPVGSLLATGALVLALVIAELFPRINYYSLLLLFLTDPVEALLRRRKAAGVPPEEPG